MPETDYELTIDDSTVEKSLKDTQSNFDKMGKAGDDAMKKVSKSININITGALTIVNNRFVQLSAAAMQFGKQAVAVFANVMKSSMDAAVEFDVTRKKFISIFEGQEGAADAVMDKISKRASELGLDMNEALSLSRAFIPDVKGTEDPLGAIDDLLVGVRALAEEDPIQGVIGARMAIDEAMSGSLRSLKERFEFTKVEVDILKDAQKELGQVVGSIEGINTVMERRGVDVEALKGTYTQAMGEMGFAASKLRIELGKPVATAMTKSMETLNKALTENSDDLLLMAGAIGDVVGKVVDFIGTNLDEFIGSIDTDGVLELVDAINSATNAAELLLDSLFNLGDETLFNTIVGWLTSIVDGLQKAAVTAAQLVAMDKAESARRAAEAEAFRAPLEKKLAGIGSGDISTSLKYLPGLVVDFGNALTTTEEKAIAATEGQKAYDQAIKDSLPGFEKFSAAEKADTERKEERRKATEKNTEADLAQGEALLKLGDAASETSDALSELGLTEEDLAKIQEDVVKTQEKLVDMEGKFAQKRLDIARDTLRERADLELKFSQERADLARDSLEDVDAIETDHRHAVEDQRLRLSRNSRAIGKKQGKDRANAEKTLRRDLLDVEENYQAELRRIQRTAQQSLESAERGLDAQAFVEALRQQEVAQQEAAISRGEAEGDVRAGHAERLEDLKQAQAEERSTLQQADQDKLEDLQIQLGREFEAQALSDELALEHQALDEERRLEQQMISEERRLEDQATAEQRQLEALLQGQAERLAKMVEGLDEETAAVILAEANKLAAIEDFAGAAQAVLDGLIKNVKAKAAKTATEDKPSKSAPAPVPIAGRPRLGGEVEGGDDIAPDTFDLFLPVIEKKTPAEEAADRRQQEYLDRLAAAEAAQADPFGTSTGRRFGGGVSRGLRYRVGERGLEGYVPHRQFGGDARIGQPTIVGEFGEELFIPPSSGFIVPNSQMGSFLDGNQTNVQQSISNTQNNLGGFTVAQSMLEDPIQRNNLENFIMDIMSRN